MSKEIYISSTPHETRLAIVEKDELSEIYYERENEYTLAGSIYNGRVTRVLPGMQSAFVDVGLERDAFLYITDFMEEQGESADFEGGETRRSAEPSQGRSPERSPDRSPDRGSERTPDRNGERKRGDRDRGGRSHEEVRPAAGEAPEQRAAEFAAPEPPARPAAPSTSENEEEGGEGSRRWRGRRGRRRGRGGDARPAVLGEGVTTQPEIESAPDRTEEVEPGTLDRVDGQVQAEPLQSSREGRSREQRGRGREGRGRDRFPERERSAERPEYGRRAEAGDGGNAQGSSGAEPLILPGESLSKYRRGEEAAGAPEASANVSAKPKVNFLTSRPTTEINLSAAGWDGGLVLPGETLSRVRGRSEPQAAPGGAAPVSEGETAFTDEANGRDRRRDRDRRRGRGGRPDREPRAVEAEDTPTSFRSGVARRQELDPAEAVQPGVTAQHDVEPISLPLGQALVDLGEPVAPRFTLAEEGFEEIESVVDDEQTPARDLFYEPQTDIAPQATDEPSAAVLAAVEQLHDIVAGSGEPRTVAVPAPEEFHEETTEYEPGEDAAASYRVDPAGPSEFRQSSLAEDDLPPMQAGLDGVDEAAQDGSAHEFTAVQSSGEMLSDLSAEIALPGMEEDPANPVEHETVVQSVRLSDVDGTPTPTAQAAEAGAGASPQAFAPGDGPLEEELLDDDSDGFGVAASYDDDTEEETFEAGAEIGALVRDRALEQLTLSEVSSSEQDDDEDDFDVDEEEVDDDEFDETEEIAGKDFTMVEEEEAGAYETSAFGEEGERPAASTMGEFPEFTEPSETGEQEPRRERLSDRGEGRREPRRGGRDRGNRDRRGMANSRSNSRPSRHSAQNTDLPAISDLLKPGQEVLVQIAKEPIAKKGARITSHIALPGRFLVFMPTVNHVGVSRKIESDGERRRLKETLLSEKGEAAGGFIVRTAAMGATEEELRSDLRFLLNLWADIKQRSETSKSPALIYHDLNLVERILRDQVTDTFSAIWVDTETEYERVLRFLQRFQPSLMRRVKLYTKDTPLFEQFGISEEINKALRSKVWLKSGGSIVINQTEALVAIDINTGKYVGKTARLEDTIVKTNLDAIPEIVRQIRLRDLGGIIVIDFIDMDDRKNRAKVLAALEEELKNDRAPSKVLQFNDFGLVAITRKRVKQSLERTLSTTCTICAGTGMTKSPITVCNEIYVELRKMHKQLDKGDVMLRVNPEVVKQLKSGNGKWLQEMEEISGKTILVKSDPSLHPEQFDIH